MARRLPTVCVTWVELRSALRGALRSRSAPTCSSDGGSAVGKHRCEAAGAGTGGARAVRVWYVVCMQESTHSRLAEMSVVLPHPTALVRIRAWCTVGDMRILGVRI